MVLITSYKLLVYILEYYVGTYLLPTSKSLFDQKRKL